MQELAVCVCQQDVYGMYVFLKKQEAEKENRKESLFKL